MRLKILILLVFAPLMSLSAQNEAGGGYFKLKESTVDLGTISGDSIVSARFTLYNTGTEPASILKIFSDCSCTVPSYSREPIAPGDSVDFEVQYDPRKYRWGQFRRTLRLRSTAVNSHMSITVSGEIAKKYKR